MPAVALFSETDAERWRALTNPIGWQTIVAPDDPGANMDRRVQGLVLKVDEAIKAGAVDPNRIYVAGRAETSAMVFYAITRIPRPVGRGDRVRRESQKRRRYQSRLLGEFRQHSRTVGKHRAPAIASSP